MKPIKYIKTCVLNIKYLVGLFCIISALVYSCSKEPEQTQQKFEIKYKMVNQGDPNLDRVVVYCTTVFPEENITSWISTGKWRNALIYQPEYLLHNYDSIIVIPDTLGYQGCYFAYWIQVNYYDTSGKLNNKMYYKSDTIKNMDSSEISFYWPNDSSKFELTK